MNLATRDERTSAARELGWVRHVAGAALVLQDIPEKRFVIAIELPKGVRDRGRPVRASGARSWGGGAASLQRSDRALWSMAGPSVQWQSRLYRDVQPPRAG